MKKKPQKRYPRLTHPLVRGEDGLLRRASWDEADHHGVRVLRRRLQPDAARAGQ
ncbi:anaerobic selenocysteine-containing dehydrogenase [Streptomyces sp. V4I23]|uniref:hypothetical protein n=1 Tax=Streptomyces sp. V4I23 TaxID=3042282 RepID=UPI002782980F|nr:hypothetical protein [Streptomyces sp. V4I23]MDQ1007253.1 anaerobic selenocysteine-containing dehydrogenase [Streptomyces sp. V4I23]